MLSLQLMVSQDWLWSVAMGAIAVSAAAGRCFHPPVMFAEVKAVYTLFVIVSASINAGELKVFTMII